ncbi:MMPL family transporter [Mycolicibacillus trivialis]|uniref:SSD domain-containing protein n=1 Tax=Mycolicibacillus trivialis TaxID=1798 RepID=A0A1X2EQ83_9MYCO|nr:MMPL family transporter [Mycolicibacillus trivialis]ORX08400.1 hypothetical protein AWC30_01845 [Mycolicibacillus trivialis]
MVTGRRSWLVALALAALFGALTVLCGPSGGADRSPELLPPDSESARAEALRAEFPGGQPAVILVATRVDGTALLSADIGEIERARARMAAVVDADEVSTPPLVIAEDSRAALSPVPIAGDLSGFALDDTVTALRSAATDGLADGLRAQVTGGPAFGADIADAFTSANVTLLVVTALVVAVLLILTYRSPVLWLLPLLVIGLADRVSAAVGTALVDTAGLSVDGSTAGITSVLVFGAGTNYALLLISRYREELTRTAEHRAALRTAVARAGPAILASNATVVLAVAMLLLAAAPSTRSLGLAAAIGLLLAVLFVLAVLPPLLALAGVRLFWPLIPRPGDPSVAEAGVWHRVATRVADNAARVTVGSLVVLAVLTTGLLGTSLGLTQTEQFRVRAESVTGFETLAAHFPSGTADPTLVIGSVERAGAMRETLAATPGVVSVRPMGPARSGLTRWSVVVDGAPASDRALDTIAELRGSAHAVDPAALVGGSDAQALDVRDAADRDRKVIIPALLAVVLVVLYVLLRAVLAPLILVAITALSALAALGLGSWAGVHVFGFPALDQATPLFALLFLIALGVDYTIFLVTRAREETPGFGTRDGIVRAVSATGAVITSAGIVLASVFLVLGVLPLIVLTQLGIIVGLGILLDTFVVRTLVIPAVFTWIGPRIWWPALRAPGP